VLVAVAQGDQDFEGLIGREVGLKLLACWEVQMRGCLPQPKEPGALESP
jgi:hypothetical protein